MFSDHDETSPPTNIAGGAEQENINIKHTKTRKNMAVRMHM